MSMLQVKATLWIDEVGMPKVERRFAQSPQGPVMFIEDRKPEGVAEVTWDEWKAAAEYWQGLRELVEVM